MKNEKPINVYWWANEENNDFFYPNPVNLLDNMYDNKNPKSGPTSLFACPAITTRFKNIYFFKSPIDANYIYDFSNPEAFYFAPLREDKPNFGIRVLRPASLNNKPHVELGLFYSMFSDEPLIASFTPPFFHEPKYFKYGTSSPGAFDIGKWCRPYPMELVLWKETGEFKVEQDEPLFYVEFLTERPVIIHRVKTTQKLIHYADQCGNIAKKINKRQPLFKRYEQFKDISMRDMLLKEILENTIN